MIHHTAIIDKNARLGNNVKIGAYSVIGPNVIVGDNTEIKAHCVIEPYVELGPDCTIYQFAAIGAPPQSVKFEGEETWVKIGSGTMIREFVTIHRGTGFGGGITRIGDKCFLMAYTHIAHDCIVGNNVVMSNNATLAGHIEIGHNATVGGLVAIHQFVRIGEYAFIGGKSAVVKDIPPYVIAAGDRARLHGLNRIGLKRQGFSELALNRLKKAYRIIFRIGLTLNEAIERVKAELEPTAEVTRFIEFIQNSKRGITR